MINPRHLKFLPGLLMAYAQAFAGDAEFAVRWAPKVGGPADLTKVSDLLPIQGKSSWFDVRYFEVGAAKNVPEGFVAIVRERVKATKTETTWKYRGTEGFPTESEGVWKCPLRKEAKRKDEVDISFLADGTLRKAYSRSCTSKTGIREAVPAGLSPKQKGRSSKMNRRESADESLTAEEWRLSSGDVVLEVSMKGQDTPADLNRFKQVVVAKLLAAGAIPLDRSKTEIGTECH
jgi:hypothetical protein